MAYSLACRPACQVQAYRRRLANSSRFPITQLLSVADVNEALAAEGCSFRERVFTPVVTLWIFLSQVLDPEHSCRQAVLRFVAWLAAHGRKLCSSQTGAYCQARQRLPEACCVAWCGPKVASWRSRARALGAGLAGR
jgi:transcriptional regulator GlxA family with amidase domain